MATLKTQRGVLLQQNRELAASYRNVLQEAQSIKTSLEGRKDTAKEWLNQEEEAVIVNRSVWPFRRSSEALTLTPCDPFLSMDMIFCYFL